MAQRWFPGVMRCSKEMNALSYTSARARIHTYTYTRAQVYNSILIYYESMYIQYEYKHL